MSYSLSNNAPRNLCRQWYSISWGVLGAGIGYVSELHLVIGLKKDAWSLSMSIIRFIVVNQNLIWFCQQRKLLSSNFSGFAERISLVAINWWSINIFVIIMLQTSPKIIQKESIIDMLKINSIRLIAWTIIL